MPAALSHSRGGAECPLRGTWFAWIWLSLGKLKFFQECSMSQCHGWGGSEQIWVWREIPVWIQSTGLALCSDRQHRCFCWSGKQKEIIQQAFPRPWVWSEMFLCSSDPGLGCLIWAVPPVFCWMITSRACAVTNNKN